MPSFKVWIMRIFLIALLSLISAFSVGCAGQRITEKAQPIETDTIHKTVGPVARECSRLATFGGASIPGWTLAAPAATYNKKSIFDYINGAAELYFAYDFRAAAAAEYQDSETSIIIDVYDMTTPENAFGIYSLNRYPGANYVNIGNEGILTDANLDFWKGRYFCKVYSFDMSEKYQKDVVNFGGRLALNIKEAGAEPSVIGKLPQNSLMPKTARFFSRKLGLDSIHYVSKENVLNLDSETKGVVAEYQVDDTVFPLFVIEYPSSDAASRAFETYSSYLVEEGDKLTVIGLKDYNIWGFWDVEKPETAKAILQNLLSFLR